MDQCKYVTCNEEGQFVNWLEGTHLDCEDERCEKVKNRIKRRKDASINVEL